MIREIKIFPVYVDGEAQLFDVFVDDVWQGSVRLLEQAATHLTAKLKEQNG